MEATSRNPFRKLFGRKAAHPAPAPNAQATPTTQRPIEHPIDLRAAPPAAVQGTAPLLALTDSGETRLGFTKQLALFENAATPQSTKAALRGDPTFVACASIGFVFKPVALHVRLRADMQHLREQYPGLDLEAGVPAGDLPIENGQDAPAAFARYAELRAAYQQSLDATRRMLTLHANLELLVGFCTRVGFSTASLRFVQQFHAGPGNDRAAAQQRLVDALLQVPYRDAQRLAIQSDIRARGFGQEHGASLEAFVNGAYEVLLEEIVATYG